MESYKYIIQQHNLDQLLDLVYSTLNKKLVASYEGETLDGHCHTSDSNITFVFFNNLTQSEKDSLDSLVNDYVFNPDYDNSKKFKINDSVENPLKIDYDILGFHKKRTITKGELRKVEYYKKYVASSLTYSDLVVCEFREYSRDVVGLVTARTQTSNWILKNESIGMTSVFTKYYSPVEAINEGISLRKNLIAEAKIYSIGAISLPYSFDLLTSVTGQLNIFIEGYKTPLINAISASTKPYLGVAQVERVTATTIVDSVSTQTDSVTVNSVEFSFASSATPTKSEISNGLVSLITGSTNSSIKGYVTANIVNADEGVFDVKSTIPGWAFSISGSSRIGITNSVQDNNTVKLGLVNILS
jgi:hypothetical protein